MDLHYFTPRWGSDWIQRTAVFIILRYIKTKNTDCWTYVIFLYIPCMFLKNTCAYKPALDNYKTKCRIYPWRVISKSFSKRRFSFLSRGIIMSPFRQITSSSWIKVEPDCTKSALLFWTKSWTYVSMPYQEFSYLFFLPLGKWSTQFW